MIVPELSYRESPNTLFVNILKLAQAADWKMDQYVALLDDQHYYQLEVVRFSNALKSAMVLSTNSYCCSAWLFLASPAQKRKWDPIQMHLQNLAISVTVLA